jgi:hypothetical protein
MVDMQTKSLRLGDTVSGTYHGVAFTGVIKSYDGSGYLYVAPVGELVVYGIARDTIAICPDSEERDSLKLVSRPETIPEVKDLGYACMGIVTIR